MPPSSPEGETSVGTISQMVRTVTYMVCRTTYAAIQQGLWSLLHEPHGLRNLRIRCDAAAVEGEAGMISQNGRSSSSLAAGMSAMLGGGACW